MKKIKAILVHGTFARHALWDDCREEGKADSVFVAQLRAALAARGVALTVEPFHWSGSNSHTARRFAAIRLNRRLNAIEDAATFPDGLFVIAHSHGGTVARLAVNLDPSDVDPDGVITFGSPFVRFEPRPLRRLFGALVWVLRVLIACGVALAALLGLFAGAASPAGVAFLAALGLGLGLLADRWLRRMRDRLEAIQAKLTRDFDPPSRGKTRYLNVLARFDEAGLLLRLWSFPTWLYHSAISTLIGTAFAITLCAGAALVWLALDQGPYLPGASEAVAALDAALLQPLLDAATDWLGATGRATSAGLALGVMLSGLVTVAALMALMALATPFGVVLPWMLRTSGFAFGGEKLAWGLASDINVARKASREAEVRMTFLPQAWRRGFWQHNFYYQDPALVEELAARLADWGTAPSRLSQADVESWIARAARLVFQLGILAAFFGFALYLAVAAFAG